MILRLAPSTDAEALIHIDDQPAPIALGWANSKVCYEKACHDVSAAFCDYRRLAARAPYHFLLVEGSKYWIRTDRLDGALLWSYNLHLLVESISQTSATILQIEASAPPAFLSLCVTRHRLQLVYIDRATKDSRCTKKGSRIATAKTLFRFVIRDLQTIARLYVSTSRLRQALKPTCESLRFSNSKASLPSPPTLPLVLLAIGGLKSHRFGYLLKCLSRNYSLLLFSPKEDLSAHVADNHQFFSPYQFISKAVFFTCIIRSIYLLALQEFCLAFLGSKYKFFVTFFRQSPAGLLQIILNLSALKHAFSALNPSLVVSQGSYNGPHTKRIFFAASLAHVPSISIEQKIIFPNNLAYIRLQDDANLAMPSAYIVAHEFSKKSLESWGLDPASIDVGYRGPILNAENTPLSIAESPSIDLESDFVIASRNRQPLLVLFSDSSRVNLSLLRYIDGLADDHHFFLVREHPNLPIDQQPEALRFLESSLWINCTSHPWSFLRSFDSVIAISSCSSAGLEAIEYGAAIIWLPFCSDLSVVHSSMIDAVGEICLTPHDLKSLLEDLVNHDHFSVLYRRQLEVFIKMQLRPSGDLVSSVLRRAQFLS
jgi:hypothetical protein